MASCFYPIQTAEKGTAWMRMVATGRPGHASIPHDDNAVATLARAVDRLSRARLPMHIRAPRAPLSKGWPTGWAAATGAALILWLEMARQWRRALLETALRSQRDGRRNPRADPQYRGAHRAARG